MTKKKSPHKKLLKQWKAYLTDSRLSPEEQARRAKEFTRKRMKPNTNWVKETKMTEIVIYYLILNILFFGSIVAVCKYVESAASHYINNYELYQKKLVDAKRKFK